MHYIKKFRLFDSVDISKYMKDIRNHNLIYIDPYDEEDWGEIEMGDYIFYVDSYLNVNIDIYDGTQDMVTKYHQLYKDLVIKELIRHRNRMVTRHFVDAEKKYRYIGKLKNQIDNIDDIYKKGLVTESNKYKIEDIESGNINNFIIYYISANKDSIFMVDKYECTIKDKIKNESSDWWEDVVKHRHDINIELNRITFNLDTTLGTDIYMSELVDDVDSGDIVLETANTKSDIYDSIQYKVVELTKSIRENIDYIKDGLSVVDDKLERKIFYLNKRFNF